MIKIDYDARETNFQQERATLAKFDSGVKKLESTKQKNREEVDSSKLEIQQLSHDLKQLDIDQTNASVKVRDLRKSYPWLNDREA